MAVGNYSSGPPAAKTVGTKSTVNSSYSSSTANTSQGCQFQDYHPYHTALDGRRLAASNEADITIYFMDDVGDDERWESGRATIEGAGSAHMNVNNTMLLEADKGPIYK